MITSDSVKCSELERRYGGGVDALHPTVKDAHEWSASRLLMGAKTLRASEDILCLAGNNKWRSHFVPQCVCRVVINESAEEQRLQHASLTLVI
jgi:hypothetical protein